MRPITVFSAPSNLGLKPPAPRRVPGVRKAPRVLISNGLLFGLGALDGGRIKPPPYRSKIDPATGIRNAYAIRQYSLALAEAVEEALRAEHFPLVVGGDCSILIGTTLALRRLGRFGLIFLDGHTDYLTPETSATGGAAGMDLAIVTGCGADLLTDIDGLKPYIRDSNVVIFGNRDIDDRDTYPAQEVFESDVSMITLDYAREIGIDLAAALAVELLKQRGVEGFWIHLDVDVIDSELMPAVDSPMPGGMTYDELIGVLRTLFQSGLAVGMQTTIYDPDLDPDGSAARAFVDALVESFALP